MIGVTNPDADNYEPAATENSFLGTYQLNIAFHTMNFEDYKEAVDKSFTLSYSVEGKNWVFFHDYIPDFYFHTREKLWSVKDQQIFKHNAGPFGRYYKEERKPFFVDVVFRSDSDMVLETVNWVSEVLDTATAAEDEWKTLTHITIWNSQQHSTRIALSDVFSALSYSTSRKTQGEWSFDDFRNALKTRGMQFLNDLFHDYLLLPDTTSKKAWYNQELLEDKYFIVRFEFDNKSGKQLVLHQTNVQALKSDR